MTDPAILVIIVTTLHGTLPPFTEFVPRAECPAIRAAMEKDSRFRIEHDAVMRGWTVRATCRDVVELPPPPTDWAIKPKASGPLTWIGLLRSTVTATFPPDPLTRLSAPRTVKGTTPSKAKPVNRPPPPPMDWATMPCAFPAASERTLVASVGQTNSPLVLDPQPEISPGP